MTIQSAPTTHEIYLHDRILDKLVLWMIPRSITPNMITWLRFFLVPFVVYLNMNERYHIGIPLFLFAAFTDAVDGSLARTRNQITDFGKLFDPLADKLLIGSMVVVLVLRNLQPVIGIAVLVTEVIFILSASIIRILGRVPQANIWGKIKMFLECLAVCVILLGLTFQNTFMFAAASWIFGAAIIFAFISLFFHGI